MGKTGNAYINFVGENIKGRGNFGKLGARGRILIKRNVEIKGLVE
jgi:hypothetical protein